MMATMACIFFLPLSSRRFLKAAASGSCLSTLILIQALSASARAAFSYSGTVRMPMVIAVLIASPDVLHAEQTLARIAAGKPTLCEKPLSYSVEEAERVVAAHRAAVGDGVPLVHQGFMRRFDPGYVAQKRAVDSGEHGRPVMVHSVGRGITTGPGATDETVIFNSAIHDLDIVPVAVGA